MKLYNIETEFGDHFTILLNGRPVYTSQFTNGHKIELSVPDGEPEYKFDFDKNEIGRARRSSKLKDQTFPPTDPKVA